jgi:hypothetical protein
VRLWQSMDLPLDFRDGRLDATQISLDLGDQRDRNTRVLHMFLWILCRVTNYLAVKARGPLSAHTQSPVSVSSDSSRARSQEWTGIKRDVDNLSASTLSLLVADVVYPRPAANSCATSNTFVEEAWFTSSVLAMAAIYFHTIMILLLRSMPNENLSTLSTRPNGPPDWMSICHSLQQDITDHARKLISIAVGVPQYSVKVHMLQPLYIAGQCLSDDCGRKRLVELLEEMEWETGIATGYRVQELVREWGTPFSQPRSQLDAELSDLSSSDE